jgi:hypothetical protein
MNIEKAENKRKMPKFFDPEIIGVVLISVPRLF